VCPLNGGKFKEGFGQVVRAAFMYAKKIYAE